MVQINKKIIENIRTYGVTPQTLGTTILILDCLDKGKYEVLDALDDGNKEQQMLHLYRDLQRKELIDYVDDGISNYYITETGKSLVDYIQNEIDQIPSDPEEIVERLGMVAESPVEDWIEEYITLFPEGIIAGKRLRVSTKQVLTRMADFLDSYPYPKSVVLEATREYLEQEGLNEYTRNCFYFIYKQVKGIGQVSDLATYCENIKRRGTIEKKTNFDTI